MLVRHSDLADGGQPMEVVAQAKNARTLGNQPVDDPLISRFWWKIDNFSRLQTNKEYSEMFIVGGYKWRLLIFPKGNNVEHLSLYLDVPDKASFPYAEFSLAVISQLDDEYSVRKDAKRLFNARERDWGFTTFMRLSELQDPSRGYLVNDTFVVGVEFHVVDSCTFKSKETGLKNKETNSDIPTESHIPKDLVDFELVSESDIPKDPINFKPPAEDARIPNSHSIPSMSPRQPSSPAAHTLKQTSSSAMQTSLPNPASSLSATQTDSPVRSQTLLEDFAALFEDISGVVGGVSSSLASDTTLVKAAVGPDAGEISKSLSVLKDVANRSFSEIPSNLRAELTSALQVLVQATTLPSAQALAVQNFCNQFESLCQSCDFSVAVFNNTQQFFDSKDGTYESLKQLNESQLKIKSSIHGVKKEKEQLQRRLRELENSESQLLEDYIAVGTEARGVKAEWDGLIAKNADMVEQRQKAENEKVRIEILWNSFISLFK